MQVTITCSDCGRHLGTFVVPSGKDATIEVHACYHSERYAYDNNRDLTDAEAMVIAEADDAQDGLVNDQDQKQGGLFG